MHKNDNKSERFKNVHPTFTPLQQLLTSDDAEVDPGVGFMGTVETWLAVNISSETCSYYLQHSRPNTEDTR